MTVIFTLLAVMSIGNMIYYATLYLRFPQKRLYSLSLWTNVYLMVTVLAFHPLIGSAWLVSVGAAFAAYYCYDFFLETQETLQRSSLLLIHLLSLLVVSIPLVRVPLTIGGQTQQFQAFYVVYRVLWCAFEIHIVVVLMRMWKDQKDQHEHQRHTMIIPSSMVLFLVGGVISQAYFLLMLALSVVPASVSWSHLLVTAELVAFVGTYGCFVVGSGIRVVQDILQHTWFLKRIEHLRSIGYFLLIAPLWKKLTAAYPSIHLPDYRFREALFSFQHMEFLLYRSAIESVDGLRLQGIDLTVHERISSHLAYREMIQTLIALSIRTFFKKGSLIVHTHHTNFLWFLVVLNAIAVIANRLIPSTPIIILVLTFTPVTFALIHGAMRYRWQGILLFVVLTLVMSNMLENLSIVTGFPFGQYQYSAVLGPKLLFVPLLIGPAYVAVGYLAWVLATIIVGQQSSLTGMPATIGIPVLASVLMVSWDLTFDPTSSTINHWWVWAHGGAYFGVPWSNYAGWFLTVFVIYQLFAVFLRLRTSETERLPAKTSAVQAIAMYATIAIGAFVAVLVTRDTVIIDAAGVSWHTAQITQAEAIAAALTMIPGAILAAIRLQGAPATVTQPVHHLSDIDPQMN